MRPTECRCCGETGLTIKFEAREMMFGRRERFVYDECPTCASLQIARVPANLGDYYPADYYSFDVPDAWKSNPTWKRRMVRWLVTRLPGLTSFTRRHAEAQPVFHWARLARISRSSAVLDVGCGAGGLLWRMRREGYARLVGIDPYLALQGEVHVPGLQLRRQELAEVTEQFDVVMMHHALEHLADPLRGLRAATTRLRPKGRLLVRIPLAASPVAQEYGIDWVHLDSPRHLVIPSRAGFGRLVERAGLRIVHEENDSTEGSILFSENYRKDIAMKEQVALFGVPEFRAAGARIRALNRAGLGDLGLFVLKRA